MRSGRIIRSALEWLMSRSCQRRDILQRNNSVAANDARQAAQSLASSRIALVRHR